MKGWGVLTVLWAGHCSSVGLFLQREEEGVGQNGSVGFPGA